MTCKNVSVLQDAFYVGYAKDLWHRFPNCLAYWHIIVVHFDIKRMIQRGAGMQKNFVGFKTLYRSDELLLNPNNNVQHFSPSEGFRAYRQVVGSLGGLSLMQTCQPLIKENLETHEKNLEIQQKVVRLKTRSRLNEPFFAILIRLLYRTMYVT